MKNTLSLYAGAYSGFAKEVWLFVLVVFINRAGTMVIPFLSIYLTTQLGYTFSQVGWVLTSYGLGSLSGSFLGGILTDKVGYKKTILLALFLPGVVFPTLLFIDGFEWMCLGFYALAVVADTLRPGIFVAMSNLDEQEDKTRSISLARLAIHLGLSFGPVIGGIVISYLSYKFLFLIDGVSCFMAGILFAFFIPSKKKVAKQQEIVKRQSAYSDQTYWYFLGIFFIMCLLFTQLLSTLPLFYKTEYLLTERDIGWIFGANSFLIFMLEMPVVHHFIQRKTNKVSLITIGVALMGGGFLLLPIQNSYGILIVFILLFTLGEIIGFPFTNSLAIDRAKLGKQGQYMGLYSVVFSMAYIIGPNLGMQIIEQLGFVFNWGVMATLAFIAVITSYGLKKRWEKNSNINI